MSTYSKINFITIYFKDIRKVHRTQDRCTKDCTQQAPDFYFNFKLVICAGNAFRFIMMFCYCKYDFIQRIIMGAIL